MKLLNPSAEIQFRDVEATDQIAVYKKLEQIARLCYKSEDKITDTSHEKMLKSLNDHGHFAMLEHQVFVIEVSFDFMKGLINEYSTPLQIYDEFRRACKYLNFTTCGQYNKSYVSGSATAFKNLWQSIYAESTNLSNINKNFAYLCLYIYNHYPLIMKKPDNYIPPTEIFMTSLSEDGQEQDVRILSNEEIWALPYQNRRHHDYITALIITDRGVTHEIVRHRPVSYAQESTRYCNYGKSEQVQFIIPSWFDERTKVVFTNRDLPMTLNDERYIEAGGVFDYFVKKLEKLDISSFEMHWFEAMLRAEDTYLKITTKEQGDGKWIPQQSRSVLPNSLKTEIYVTCNLAEWEWFMRMRVPNTAHPDMRQITKPLQDKIKAIVPEFPTIIND